MLSLVKRRGVNKTLSLVLPCIEHVSFLKNSENFSNIDKVAIPLTEPIAGDLVLAFLLSSAEGAELLTPSLLEKHKLQDYDLKQIAKVNALKTLGKLKTRTDGLVHRMTAEHNMAASSILFSELWDSIERGGGKIVAAFPNRNTALYVRLNLPNAVSVMKKAIAKDEFSGADELSKMLYCRVNGRWCLFEL